ncbi:DUF3426 domain-containing protein [Alcaligenaceae bacterium C4P045]|nr:DUF3426 domain-containing protein [Alcaligenaceae bacterium C4P045]
MASLTTRCPQCGTAFKVVADQLRVRQGLVRCGVCSAVFDGYARLIGEAESTPAAPAVAHPVTPAPYSAPTYLPPVTSAPSAPSTAAPTSPAPAYVQPRPPQQPTHQPPAPSPQPAPPPYRPSTPRATEPAADDAEPPWAMPRATPAEPSSNDYLRTRRIAESPSHTPFDTPVQAPAHAPEPAVLRDRSHASRRGRDDERDDEQGDERAHLAHRNDDADRDDEDRDPQAGVSGRGQPYSAPYRDSNGDDQAAGLRAAGFGYARKHANTDHADDYRSSEPHHAGYRSDDYASKAYLVERDDSDDHTLAGAVEQDEDDRPLPSSSPAVAGRPARNPRFDLSEDDDVPRREEDDDGDAPYIPTPALSPWDNRREPAVFTQPRAAASPADQWGRTGQSARNPSPRGDAAFFLNDDDAATDASEHDERYAPDARDIRPTRVTLDDDLADDNVARDGRDDEWDEDDQDAAPVVRGETRVRHAGDPHAGATPPEFMDDEVERQGAFGRWFWGILCVLALIALALASLWTYRNAIVTSAPQLRPVMAQLCARLGCEVGYARRIDRIAILSSSLQPPAGGFTSEPGRNRLIMRAVIRNRYNMPQPLPALTLELTDFSDTIVARKVLRPEMYLPANLAAQPFAAEGELSVAVPIDVTDLQVNGYQIGKFFP